MPSTIERSPRAPVLRFNRLARDRFQAVRTDFEFDAFHLEQAAETA